MDTIQDIPEETYDGVIRRFSRPKTLPSAKSTASAKLRGYNFFNAAAASAL